MKKEWGESKNSGAKLIPPLYIFITQRISLIPFLSTFFMSGVLCHKNSYSKSLTVFFYWIFLSDVNKGGDGNEPLSSVTKVNCRLLKERVDRKPYLKYYFRIDFLNPSPHHFSIPIVVINKISEIGNFSHTHIDPHTHTYSHSYIVYTRT